MSRGFTPEQRQELTTLVVAGYLAGRSVRSVAAEAGVSYTWARELLVGAGVSMRGRGGSRALRRAAGLPVKPPMRST